MRALFIGLVLTLCLGCQTTPPADYRELTERVASGETVAVADLRTQFLARGDLPEQLERLTELEVQALELVEDEPLKLGSIGSAILDTYYASLTGHYALTRFYAYVESPEAAAPHQRWLDDIRSDMQAEGDGSREKPFPAVSGVEAQMYAISQGMSPVGSIYQSSDDVAFSMLLQAKPPEQPVISLNFDLTGVYQAERMGLADSESNFTPFSLIGMLAKRNDPAAQAAIGAFLASQGRIEDAIDWLRAASRVGNLLANSILARLYWEQANGTEDEAAREAALAEVLENYLHAIALGSTEAMYALGILYLNEHYGEENVPSGITLLTQAADMNSAEAALFLAHLNYAGEVVDRDLDLARSYYATAAELESVNARHSYARFLLDPATGQTSDTRIINWLDELAQEDDATAMLLLGNLYARGVGVDQSSRRAFGYFKKAVKTTPTDASLVNEVAWTLTVSDVDDLKRARYALRIMDKLMNNDEIARRRPEYLDTWAAAYAANGDFERAISLQQEALAVAEAEEFADVRQVLEDHLQLFRDSQTITERAP
jgi:TPR repeat protein